MQGASPLLREQLRGWAARPPAAQGARARPRGDKPGGGAATSDLRGQGCRDGAEERGRGRNRSRGTKTERQRQMGKEKWREGRDAQERDAEESANTRNYREIANKTEARGVHRTMFVILHRDFFCNFFFEHKKCHPPPGRAVL